jgi:hypothetical protein
LTWKQVELLSNPRAPLILNEVVRPVAGLDVEARLFLLQLAVGLHHFLVKPCVAVGVGARAFHLLEPGAKPSNGELRQVEMELLMVEQLSVSAFGAPPGVALNPIDAAAGIHARPDAPGRGTPPGSSGVEGRPQHDRMYLAPLALPRRIDVDPAHRKLGRAGGWASLKVFAHEPPFPRPFDDVLRVRDLSQRQGGQEAEGRLH